MRLKRITFFVLAVSVSLLAASHRWPDSGHTMGLITGDGGKVRHPAFFQTGEERYTLIVTAKVMPPYRGNVRVALEGEPRIDYALFAAGPVMDLGLRNLPEFRDDTFFGVEPQHRLALWVRMTLPNSPASQESKTPYKYTLTFEDADEGKRVLTVPLIFRNKGGEHRATGNHH